MSKRQTYEAFKPLTYELVQKAADRTLDYEQSTLVFGTIERLAKAVAWKMGRRDLFDDLTSETWLIMPTIAARLERDVPVEPYVLAYMRNIMLALSRKHPQTSEEEERLAQEGTSEEHPDNLPDYADRDDQVNAIDSIAAKALATERLKQYGMKDDGSLEKVATTPKRVRTIGDDHRELKQIRVDLGLTQIIYAERLGLSLPTLITYEQGKVKKVPVPIINLARQLKAEASPKSAEYIRLNNMEIGDIVKEWMTLLEIPNEDHVLLATKLDKTRSTVARWKKNSVRPNTDVIVECERKVRKLLAEAKPAMESKR